MAWPQERSGALTGLLAEPLSGMTSRPHFRDYRQGKNNLQGPSPTVLRDWVKVLWSSLKRQSWKERLLNGQNEKKTLESMGSVPRLCLAVFGVVKAWLTVGRGFYDLSFGSTLPGDGSHLT